MLKRTEYSIDISTITMNFEDNKTVINEPTGNFFYDEWKIKSEFKNTIWEDILKSLPETKGEARIIKMAPGTTYMSHADIDDRWHLSLQGENSYLIDLTENTLYLLRQDNFWYEMDAGRIHVASNFGSIDRYQLVIRKLLLSTSYTDLVKVTIRPTMIEKFNYRYQFDNIISPWLNAENKKGMMKNFSFEDNIVQFEIAESELSTLKLTDDFEIIIS